MSTPVATGAAFAFIDGQTELPVTNARVTVLADGTLAVVAFAEDNGLSIDDFNIIITRNIDGALVGSFASDESSDGTDGNASIAALANGNVVVGFSEGASTAGGFEISDRNGNRIALDNGLPAGATDVRVAGLASGNFALAFTAANGDLHFKLYNPSGGLITGNFFDSFAFTISKPEITPLADGGFAIGAVLDDNNGDPVFYTFNADGSLRDFGTTSASGVAEDDTFVFGLANGNFVSVFTNESGSDGSGDGVFGVIHQPDGTANPGVVFVNSTTAANQRNAAGVGLSDGTFVVAWTDESVGGGNGDIRARRFNADGGANGGEFVVASGASTQDDVSVAEMADGRIIFTWEDDAEGHFDIRARIFDPRDSAITRFGTTLNDQWVGTLWSDTLLGQDGRDTIGGGGGDDRIEGGDGDDTLLGDNGNDVILGGAGEDTLVGGAGFDQLVGGDGDDDYFVDAFDTILETATGGSDRVEATIDFDLSILGGGFVENAVAATTAGAISLFGNSGANVLTGSINAAANTLTGRGGNDTYIAGTGDTVVEDSAGGGIDTVRAFAAQYTLGMFVEHLVLVRTSDQDGNGNGLANTITGNEFVNILDGKGGNDTLFGLDGADILIGGAGRDTMTGGLAGDIFRFLSRSHSPNTANRDIIRDFDDGDPADQIDVSALFGPLMSYRHTAAFTRLGQVRINDIAGADLIVEVNSVGTLAADFSILLKSTAIGSMNGGDFIL